jgi:hypothetical protein
MQLVVLFAAVEEGVLRFGECLWGVMEAFSFFSHEADLVRSCALVRQCMSLDSLSYRQELLQDFELNVTDQLKRKSTLLHVQDVAQCLGEIPVALLSLS